MIFKRMREQILDKAIRGLLVPQLAEDGVVDQIGPAPSEVPFEIPEPWKWISAKNVFELISGRDLEKKDISESLTNDSQIPYITGASQIINEEIVVNRWTSVASVYSYLDDLLLTCKGTVGKTAINKIGNIHIARQIMALRPNKETVILEYLKIYIDFISQQLSNEAKSMIPGISRPTILNRFIPIPPLEEQKRIAAKIESLFDEIDRAEKAYEELQSLANVLRGQILQKAIQGKLVPQLPEDGVVEQIGDAPTEVPFELPASWKWSTLTSICSLITDGTHNSPKNSTTKDSVYKNLYITAKNIKDYGIDLSKPTYVNDKDHTEITKRCSPCYGDILFVKDGATTGVVTSNNLSEPFSMLSSVALIRTIPSFMDGKFLIYVLRSPHISTFIRTKMKGTGITRVTLNILKSIPIPIPPLAEQKRIVAKVDTLLEQIDLMTK